MCFQCIEEGTGKAEIALHELFLILGTIDTCEVEHKISLSAEVVKFFLCVVKVVLEDFIYLYALIPTSLAFFYIVKLGTKVSSHETFSSCDQDFHFLLGKIKNTVQFVLDVFKRGNLGLSLFKVQAASVI